MSQVSNHFPEVLEQLNEPEGYEPTPADWQECFEQTRNLDGLRALVAMVDQLADDAHRNRLIKGRGKAQKHHYRGLAVAYRNVAGWLRLELAWLHT